nr:kinesin-like protein KIF25 [Cavia porcellus]
MAWYERRAPSGSNFNSDDGSGPIGQGFSSRQAFQLRRQARYQERVGRSRREATWFYALLNGQQQWPSSAHPALVQICHLIQKLKQDVKDFRSSFLDLLSSCQAQYQEQLSNMAAAIRRAQLSTENLQEMDMRYHVEKQRRRELHNTLVELKGNIRVHCRIRPLLPLDCELDDPILQNGSDSREVAHAVDEFVVEESGPEGLGPFPQSSLAGGKLAVQSSSPPSCKRETILVRCDRPGHPLINKTYNFERVYGPAEPQTAVFADVCPLLTSLLDGYNVCIMAYGQTGSGKSYTMLGPELPSDAHSDLGLIPRAVEEFFRLISENPSGSPKVDVSILEIYNNDIFDLLAKDSSTVVSGVKRDVVTTQDGCTEVPLLTRGAITSVLEFMELFHQGLRLRAKNPTLVHADSSRSHLIVTVTLTTATSLASTDQQPGQTLPGKRTRASERWSSAHQASPPGSVPVDPVGSRKQVWSRLQLVDLAGSECAGMSGVTGLALRETSFINRSLAALADVLGALSEHRGHIPYRNSKLTHLLQDSIGGDAKLLVILCVSPGQKHVAETLQSLGFGTRARQVKRGQARKKSPHSQIREWCLGSA